MRMAEWEGFLDFFKWFLFVLPALSFASHRVVHPTGGDQPSTMHSVVPFFNQILKILTQKRFEDKEDLGFQNHVDRPYRI